MPLIYTTQFRVHYHKYTQSNIKLPSSKHSSDTRVTEIEFSNSLAIDGQCGARFSLFKQIKELNFVI